MREAPLRADKAGQTGGEPAAARRLASEPHKRTPRGPVVRLAAGLGSAQPWTSGLAPILPWSCASLFSSDFPDGSDASRQ